MDLKTYVHLLILVVIFSNEFLCIFPNEIHEQNEGLIVKQSKNSEIRKRPSFFIGSRYGRSISSKISHFSPETNFESITSVKPRYLKVMPQAERFFLSSRYGKRMYDIFKQKPIVFNRQINSDGTQNLSQWPIYSEPLQILSCIYTGLEKYYTCE